MVPPGGLLHKKTVMEVLNAALKASDPYVAVRGALLSAEITDVLKEARKLFVLGGGKAGAAMARAAEDVLGERIAEGLVVVKAGRSATGIGRRASLKHIRLVEAGHPVPDIRGVEAAETLLATAADAIEDDLILCLISGGGSALLTAPAEGVTLGDIQATTDALLRAGATIGELNAVRKHLSSLSGGQLARVAAPAQVLSLILSDVVGSPLGVIASGPTAPDESTYAEALSVLERYSLVSRVPSRALRLLQLGAVRELEETPKPGDPIFSRVTNYIVASNVQAVEAAASQAHKMGINAIILSTYIEGEAREVGKVLAGLGKEAVSHGRIVSRPGCILFGGETTVTVKGEGTGGRNTELALGAAMALEGWGPDILVVSLATDGDDGTSPSAGAIADGTSIERGRALGLDAAAALANNDSYTYWSKLGDAIMTGPTGTNVNDIMGIFIF